MKGLKLILLGVAIILALGMVGGILTQDWYTYKGTATLPLEEANKIIDQYPNVKIVESNGDNITITMKFASQKKEIFGIQGKRQGDPVPKVIGYALFGIAGACLLVGFLTWETKPGSEPPEKGV